MSAILKVKDGNGGWIDIPAIIGPQGAKGDTGADGLDGVPCTHEWDGTTLKVTSASGTSSANLKGEKGDPGDMQVSVYDPQGKARDIFAYIDAAITGAIEGSY